MHLSHKYSRKPFPDGLILAKKRRIDRVYEENYRLNNNTPIVMIMTPMTLLRVNDSLRTKYAKMGMQM
jgi:hypothetical protein